MGTYLAGLLKEVLSYGAILSGAVASSIGIFAPEMRLNSTVCWALALLLCIFAGYRTTMNMHRTPLPVRPEKDFDVFLSAPMAAYPGENQYGVFRSEVSEIRKTLLKYCGVETIFWAGEYFDSMDGFEPTNLALRKNMETLRQSKVFVLVYLKPLQKQTSAFVEAGMALSLGLPCIFYVRSKKHLPFMLQSADAVLPNVEINECGSVKHVVECLLEHGRNSLARCIDARVEGSLMSSDTQV